MLWKTHWSNSNIIIAVFKCLTFIQQLRGHMGTVSDTSSSFTKLCQLSGEWGGGGGGGVRSPFCFAVICILSSSAIIPLGKRELVALLLLCSECHVTFIVFGLFLMVPWFSL